MTVVINGTSGITDVNGSAAAPAITGTDTDTGVFFGTNTVSLSTGGTERLQIDPSGNAGLGVTPSAWYSSYKALQVKTSSLAAWGNNEVYLMSNAYGDSSSTYKYLATGSKATSYVQYEGTHLWNTAGTGTAGNAITFTQAMTLDASGNLLVGTTTALSKIAVFGSGSQRLSLVSPSGSSTQVGINLSPSMTEAEAAANPAQASIYATDSNYSANIIFANKATGAVGNALTERARIDTSGNLLVGTTSTTQSHKIIGQVASAWALQVVSSFATASQNYGINAAFSASIPNNSSNYFFQGNDTSLNRFIVYSNGGIANYTANNINLSDSREKTNVNPAGDYLAKICSIPVRTYNYVDQNLEEDAGLTLGVFAQDVQAVAPELVTESNWAPKGEEPKMRLSIYQTDLQYALMKCIQEQQAIINQLQADVAALKAKA